MAQIYQTTQKIWPFGLRIYSELYLGTSTVISVSLQAHPIDLSWSFLGEETTIEESIKTTASLENTKAASKDAIPG